MPGLLAIVDFQGRPDLPGRFQRQFEAALRLPWHLTDRWQDPEGRVALGRIDLGAFNPASQPRLGGGGRHVLFFEGEIHDRPTRRAMLEARGVPVGGDESADLLLATFLADGLRGVEGLNGSFFFALWDTACETLHMGGDRYGNRLHYYHWHEGRFLLGPEVGAVVAGRGDRPALSLPGLATFLAMEHPFGDETFYDGIRVFPAGTFLRLDRAGAAWLPYWSPRYVGPDEPAPRPEAAWLEEAEHRFERAVRRCMEGPLVLPLSGGTDSRTVAAFSGRRDIPALTMGEEDSQDVRYARQVAAALGLEHHVFTLEPDYMSRYAEATLTWGEGMVSLFHAHNAAFLDDVRAMAPVSVYGMTAEYFRQEMLEYILSERGASPGQGLAHLLAHARTGRRPLVHFSDDEALVEHLAKFYWNVVGPQWASEVFEPEFVRTIGDSLRAGLRETFAGLPAPATIDRLAAFNVRVRQRRFSNGGLKLTLPMLEYRKPFDDYELVDFMMTMPAMTRRRIEVAVLCARSPELARIPRTGTGLPLDASWTRRAGAFAVKQLRQRLAPPRLQTFTDPQQALRGPSRAFYESVLLDPSLAGLNFVRPQGVERLLRAHMAGEVNAASALCAIATVALWHQGATGVQAGRAAG